ncbi:MAG: 3-methyl-2-oxobutanoate hydroxymethyltransferase [Candidatus Margulisiibacteriota bacterium]|nr:MAG: 3-methyl-2-oxobutanoate hydroxymethyltransferase [Candidatus Margulisbacteria bacterium GWD2_39_127]OGI04301.1 MAG: 3-methyl-2-oxobutanoate hydroxymethyltransferase [Candidatus Margulisbacteria bacterium GWF2_38_17]OGI11794.1 MAG: 3-methyl-2-oxobutanoate hydroxymethyltransferase [Candidatus Margulisbacteria bacterium GWE2_39_32]PZM79835.1 MAG: 3-methyl-2-oxobutanoate hydroxymethyltransferase [Candidatus Margulisiibacteriota bacterium]HAR62744.1 3-methyl-2-oxobutanoate hydroxymethyltrans
MVRITISDLNNLKEKKQKIVMLTAYNYPFAKIIDKTPTHIILVGDSLGMTSLGYDSTIPVTMEDMCSATSAVARGSASKLIVADMPFLSYQTSIETAVENAGRIMRAGAHAVKIEGAEHIPAIQAIINAGIPVMGHLGFTPQSVNKLGGFKVQGTTAEAVKILVQHAQILKEAGVFALVLEMVPAQAARELTTAIDIVTLGIGAGIHVDGQVLVTDDLIGLFDKFKPKFVKQYTNISKTIEEAITTFNSEVQENQFPNNKHSY